MSRKLPALTDLPALESQPWERSPRESDEAWLFFQAYREMAYRGGPGSYTPRSIGDLARLVGQDREHLKTLSRTHSWHSRASLYDREIDRAKLAQNAQALPEVLAEHRTILKAVRKIVQVEMQKLLEKCEEQGDAVLRVGDLKSLLEIGLKLDRLTYGEATEIVKLAGEWDLSGFSLDQLRDLKAMAEKARGSIGPGSPGRSN